MKAIRLNRRGPASRRLLAVARSLKHPGSSARARSIGTVVDGLGAEGIGLALLVLTLPALIPVPGPFGMLFGAIVAALALQILTGADRLWLPARLRARAAPHAAIRAVIGKALPWIRRAESVLRENRLRRLTGRTARIAFAVPILLMAVTIALPIPLGNVVPAAALIAIALGFLTRDGLAVLVGLVTAVLALLWTGALFLFGATVLEWLGGLMT